MTVGGFGGGGARRWRLWCRQAHLSPEGINAAAFSSGCTRLQQGHGEQRSPGDRHRDDAAEQELWDWHQFTPNQKILSWSC